MNITTLYEDDNLIAVDKPAGVLAYPLPGSTEKTIGDLVGAIPCHRLDRDTSGAMILAKDEDSKVLIQHLFSERQMEKRYLTLVWGKLEPASGEINIPLGRGTKDRLKVVPDPTGRASVTLYNVKKYFPKSDMTLAEIELKTGRTHQIRVHFSAIGHPVVGDNKYSNKKSTLGRQFLHAAKISFCSPFTNQKIEICSSLPTDLDDYLGTLS